MKGKEEKEEQFIIVYIIFSPYEAFIFMEMLILRVKGLCRY